MSIDYVDHETANGIWVTDDCRNRESEYNPLSVSVVDVARTRLKIDGESPLIGWSVVDNLQVLLREYEEQDLSGYGALLVGCGATCSEIGKALLAAGCMVTWSIHDR